MEIPHYSYHFVQRVEEVNPITTFLKYKLLYTFKSPKSHQWYWVWVEVYQCDFYAVKFHLKAHRDSPNKYSLMTGLNEARPVINTCIAIMHEIDLGIATRERDNIKSAISGEELLDRLRPRIKALFK